MGYDSRNEFYNAGRYYGEYTRVSESFVYSQGYAGYYKHVYFVLDDLWPILKDRAETDAFLRYADAVDNFDTKKFEMMRRAAEIDGYRRYSDEYKERETEAEKELFVRYNDDKERIVVELLVQQIIDDNFSEYAKGIEGIEKAKEDAKRDQYRRYIDDMDSDTKLEKLAKDDEYMRYSYNYLSHKELAEKDNFSKYADDGVSSNEKLKELAEMDFYRRYASYGREIDSDERLRNAIEDKFHRYFDEIDEEQYCVLANKAIEDNFERYATDYYIRKYSAISDGYQRYRYGCSTKLTDEELRFLAEKDHYWRYQTRWYDSIEAAIQDALGRYKFENDKLSSDVIRAIGDVDTSNLKNKAIRDNYKEYDKIYYIRRIRAALDFYSLYRTEDFLSEEQLYALAQKDHYIKYLDADILEEAEKDAFSLYFDDIENIESISELEKQNLAKNIAICDGCFRYNYIKECVDGQVISLRKKEYKERIKSASKDSYGRYLVNIDCDADLMNEELLDLLKKIAKKDNYRKYEFYVQKNVEVEKRDEYSYAYSSEGGK